MKNTIRAAAGSGALLLVLVSCATVPFAKNPDHVLKLVDAFNAHDTTLLVADTSLPFLFNGEIVELKEDATTMWTNLVQSGLTIRDARVTEDVAATPGDYTRFADTMEVRTFFQKYLPKSTMLVRVSFDGGSFFMLLDGSERGYPLILGIEGGPS
jgi:hypothetical protein